MNLKAALGGRRKPAGDLDIMPVMNLFLILVPFLLVTASFVELAVLDISLPEMRSGNRQAQAPQQAQEHKPAVLNLLAIRENGIELKSPTFTFGLIPRRQEGYDYDLLKSYLTQVKQKFPEAVDVVIAPEDNIRYQVVIDVMDRCREAGFPNVSISG
ncbi:MAG: biopolymer transporter ExbD [candidate division KSB1 bacterium]|nr:biopolymer transporter ExbD [candidate division KSB1 bacterium]MDZ7274542.1 biopolymer transporter ExbD [candidate division KSB1 bacterium]MDZ7284797.1 biopolymer transporter ExbD [candidate division KSB1 bacterium]MDZ7297783.1 biopolymer transporter ExbD [candidate division KSB1 bacterium]MDZ7306428.1 biopolymer transporter ExbD [candidate division KSB1 bacterium]